MDTIQLLLIVILTITTIFMIVTGLQLIFFLKDLRRAMKKIDGQKLEKEIKREVETKKHGFKKKSLGIHSILDRIKALSPSSQNKVKKFFVKDK